MPREAQTRLTERLVPGASQSPRKVQSQVSQGAIDALPSYIPQPKDPDVEALVSGLSMFQPKLQAILQEKNQEEAQQGSFDRQAGAENKDSSAAYRRAYFATDGLVKAQEDGSALLARYNTEFDKDKGDLEGWLQEHYQGRLKGIQDEDYVEGYQKGLLPALQAIRKSHLEYQKKAVETRVETNAMQLLDNAVLPYVTSNQPIPDGYLETIQSDVGGKLGVSRERFNELLFETVRRHGDEGHFKAYELLKMPWKDGTPGLHMDPAWAQKIDQAQLHSYSAAATRSQHDRDTRQNEALYSVFAEDDPRKAQEAYNQLKTGGLFSRADDLIKWDKLFMEKLDGKPDANQLEKEGTILAKIYQGGVSYRDILEANARGEITSGSRKYLLGEVRRVQTENRTIAAQSEKKEDSVYKSVEFKSAEDFLEGMLKPRPKDDRDFMGVGTPFDRAQLAQAKLEFTRAAKGKSAEEIQPLVEDITNRYMKRREGYNKDQRENVGSGRIPFKSLKEARTAAAQGLLSPDELRQYIDYFKGQ